MTIKNSFSNLQPKLIHNNIHINMPKIPFWIFIIIAIVYFTGVRVDTMDVDASQYAEISREMMKSGDYLHLYDRGLDYLDKPPFLFWVSATSMKLFGTTNFGYKLPSILAALWAIFATYKLATRLYDKKTGKIAALVLATCQGMFLWTNDIRCDTMLMCWVTTAIWLIQEWIENKKIHYLLLGCSAIALGMMTKGPLALMVPVFCFMSNWILKREWKNFLRIEYLLGILIIALLLIPMSIGLYNQFDLHPEKLVNGHTNTSGLRFFYWSQSFGRITGESPWKNGADISFLMLNMLWSFLPWIFIFIIALITNSIRLVKQKFLLQKEQEWISTGGFLLTYLCLGMSAYQLPHYILVVFPLAAIITAVYIKELIDGKIPIKLSNFLKYFQATIMLLLLFAMNLLIQFAFPASPVVVFAGVISTLIWLFIIFYKKFNTKLVWLSASGMILINIFLTNQVYFSLLKYQIGNQLGTFVKENIVKKKMLANEIITYKMHDPMNAFPFYTDVIIDNTDTITYIANKKYVITMDDGLQELEKHGYKHATIFQGSCFKVSELTPEFLYPKTRHKEVRNYYLVAISK